MSVGVGEASLTVLLHVSVSKFGDFMSVFGVGETSLFDYTSSRLIVYIWRFYVCWGRGGKFDCNSSRLSV